MRPQMVYSRDKRLYYIADKKNVPLCWMALRRIEGKVPDERKNDMLKGWLQVEVNDGRVYHREILAFNFWSVKSGASERADIHSDEFKDYIAYHVRNCAWKGY